MRINKRFIALAVLLCSMLTMVSCSSSFEKDEALETFSDGKEYLNAVAEFLMGIECYAISVHEPYGYNTYEYEPYGYMTIFYLTEDGTKLDRNMVEIDNTEVMEALEYLFDDGCNSIHRDENSVDFSYGYVNKNIYRGLMYCLDIEEKRSKERLTTYQELDDSKWYYYEIDFVG